MPGNTPCPGEEPLFGPGYHRETWNYGTRKWIKKRKHYVQDLIALLELEMEKKTSEIQTQKFNFQGSFEGIRKWNKGRSLEVHREI